MMQIAEMEERDFYETVDLGDDDDFPEDRMVSSFGSRFRSVLRSDFTASSGRGLNVDGHSAPFPDWSVCSTLLVFVSV